MSPMRAHRSLHASTAGVTATARAESSARRAAAIAAVSTKPVNPIGAPSTVRISYDEPDGVRSFREKIDLLAPHGLSGTVSRSKRGVPALQPAHGKLSVGNALGLELKSFNRSRMMIVDFADPRLTAEIHVAEILVLILAKGSKIGERLREPRKGTVRDKDLGDLWRLMAVADPRETAGVIAELVDHDHDDVGADVRQSIEWTTDVLQDPVSRERARSTFDTFVDPAAIDRVFELWRDVLPGSDL